MVGSEICGRGMREVEVVYVRCWIAKLDERSKWKGSKGRRDGITLY